MIPRLYPAYTCVVIEKGFAEIPVDLFNTRCPLLMVDNYCRETCKPCDLHVIYEPDPTIRPDWWKEKP